LKFLSKKYNVNFDEKKKEEILEIFDRMNLDKEKFELLEKILEKFELVNYATYIPTLKEIESLKEMIFKFK
jgi:hypothetical protein